MTSTIEQQWYQRSVDDVAGALASPPGGLDEETVQRRLETDGFNELEEKGRRTRWQILLAQFASVLTGVLIAAAVISAVLGDWLEMVAILAIVVLNAVMGYVQEYRAEAAMEALKKMAVPTVRVRRDGEVVETSSREIVPGDRVLLETGNVVAADGRLAEAVNLRVEEAALTGESEPVDKIAAQIYESERALAERRNLVFMGTIVTMGRGEMIVTDTGMATELGRIAELLQTVEDERTPLQRRLDHLGRVLAAAVLGLVVVLFGLGLARGEDVETMLLTAVSLAVAAIPEALPAVVTIALSLGAQRMLKRNALIRRLPAVETLGSVDVICSDKTGTLTQNRMTVVVLDLADSRIELSDDRPLPERGDAASVGLALLGGALCNDSALVASDDGPRGVGDPTENALVVAAARLGISKNDVEAVMPRIGELPFDSTRKRMTTVHRVPGSDDGVPVALGDLWRVTESRPAVVGFTKGAVEGLLACSSEVWVHGEARPLGEMWRRRIQEAEAQLAEQGMRVLGVAVRGYDEDDGTDPVEEDLVFVGLFGLIDPPREEVPAAVATCVSAGIRPVMITGDHPLTARHIAGDVGIEVESPAVVGMDLDAMDTAELAQVAAHTSVFARVSPENKIELISAFQDSDHLVAMTGDGVNDAPALKRADIGVAMGITGTDVSKQASDMVLLDDNFATIVSAVEEGRVIYDNIRKFVKYLLTCNASELAVMIVGPLLGMPLPLLPLQILWMNLVTDGLPALALGVEPAEDDVMERPPRSATESIFGGGTTQFIVGFGAILAAVSLGIGFLYWRGDVSSWQSVLFTVLVFGQLGLALEIRSEKRSLFTVGLGSNRAMLGAVGIGLVAHLGILYIPFLQGIFDTEALTVAELAVAVGATLFVMATVEVQKVFLRSSLASTSGEGGRGRQPEIGGG